MRISLARASTERKCNNQESGVSLSVMMVWACAALLSFIVASGTDGAVVLGRASNQRNRCKYETLGAFSVFSFQRFDHLKGRRHGGGLAPAMIAVILRWSQEAPLCQPLIYEVIKTLDNFIMGNKQPRVASFAAEIRHLDGEATLQ